jgi:hypothetical protein
MVTLSDILHITVGAAPQGGFDLTHELRLLKAALLYADKVRLCSLSSAVSVLLPYLGILPDKEILDLTLYAAKALHQEPENVATVINIYQQLRMKKRRSRQEILAYHKVKKQLDKVRENFGAVAEKLLVDAKADDLFSALQSGMVEIQSFDFNKDTVAEQYVSVISEAVLSGQTYLLLDDFTGNLIRLAIKEGLIVPLGTTIIKAKQTGLSSGLFERLPLFDDATVDEIIDIRKELDQPLIRFRSAIIRFSRTIEYGPWESEFHHEIEQVFIEHVEPAILEIEEAYKANQYLVSFVKKLTDKPLIIPSSSAIGFFISQASNLPDIVTQSLSLVAGGAAIGLDAIIDWHQKNKEIKKNQLYFYYRVRKSLEA